MTTQKRMKTQLTPQQEKDLEWMSSHRAHIEFRNKILKGIGGFLLWLSVSIGNYFLLSAANITTFAQGIIAVGLEFMLALLLMLVLFKLENKKTESSFALAFAMASASSFTVTFAVTVLPIFSFIIFLALVSAFAVAFASAAIFAFDLVFEDDNEN